MFTDALSDVLRCTQMFQNVIGRMDFDNPKVYGDTSIFDGFVDLAPAPVEDPAPVYRTVRLEHCSNLARKRTWVFRFIPWSTRVTVGLE